MDKKRPDPVMDNPMRTPSGTGTGTSALTGAGNLEQKTKEPSENVGGGALNRQGTGGVKAFRCADVGPKECRWEVRGRDEQELMPQIERHGREAHNIHDFNDELRGKVHNAIRDLAA